MTPLDHRRAIMALLTPVRPGGSVIYPFPPDEKKIVRYAVNGAAHVIFGAGMYRTTSDQCSVTVYRLSKEREDYQRLVPTGVVPVIAEWHELRRRYWEYLGETA